LYACATERRQREGSGRAEQSRTEEHTNYERRFAEYTDSSDEQRNDSDQLDGHTFARASFKICSQADLYRIS
jgi:hypothetical protein